jgi:hypothetical protein
MTSINENKPKRIQRKRTKGWQMPEGAVAVTRGTPWGNPYRITHAKPSDGKALALPWWVESDGRIWMFSTEKEARGASIRLFRETMREPMRDKVRVGLRGKDLACFCSLDQPCHADVLLELANG